MEMDMPRIEVDFNTYMRWGKVLLPTDLTFDDNRIKDSSGNEIVLKEGLTVHLFEENLEEDGTESYLYGDGVVVQNESQKELVRKWFCELDNKGIYYS